MIASARKTPRQVALAGCNRQLSASLRRPNRPQESRAFRSMPSTNTTLRLRAAEEAEAGRSRYTALESLIPRASSGASNESLVPKASLRPVLVAVAIAALGAFLFGYHLGVVNGPLEYIAADLGFAGNAGLQGAVVSSTLAGAAIGSLTGSGLADSMGRRKTLLLDTIPLLVGALLSATASGLWGMIAGRVIVGIGIGLSSALVPLYISEVAPTEVRGTLGSINQLVICIGILAALLVNVALPATSWRSMFLLATLPAALLAAGMAAVCPESPRWLASKGQQEQARDGARFLWGPFGADQLDSTPVASAADQGEAVSMGEVVKNKGAIIGVALFVLQQLSGVNAIVYFSSTVFAQAGVTNGALASAAVGATNVAGTVVAASLMDRAGRKQLLTLSFTGMAAAMLAMSAGLGLPQLTSSSGIIALVGTLSYILAFALGAGAVPGLLVPEITPSRIRGKAVSLAMGAHWVFNFGIGQLFLPAVSRFGVPGVYLFFTAVCTAAVLYIKSQVVETKGLSLEQIEAQLQS